MQILTCMFILLHTAASNKVKWVSKKKWNLNQNSQAVQNVCGHQGNINDGTEEITVILVG